MKTIVFQSYRTIDVPPWIERCLGIVRQWAAGQGFDYQFFDDRLFEFAPDWYREKAQNNVLLVTDLVRLVAAKELLAGSYERAIWIDADVVVFHPHFAIDVTAPYAFCREVWTEPNGRGGVRAVGRVNNAVAVFQNGNDVLDFYIHACQRIVGQATKIDPLAVGTKFLSTLAQVLPLPLLNNVAMISPTLMKCVVEREVAALQAYRRVFGFPLYAANLCASFRNQSVQGVLMSDDVYGAAVERLLATGGAMFES